MERKLDELGRLVIPMEFRKSLGWSQGMPLKMNVDGERVIITKSEAYCFLCGTNIGLKNVKGVKMCQSCIGEMKSIFEEA